jgi:hypothetical protein
MKSILARLLVPVLQHQIGCIVLHLGGVRLFLKMPNPYTIRRSICHLAI